MRLSDVEELFDDYGRKSTPLAGTETRRSRKADQTLKVKTAPHAGTECQSGLDCRL